MYFFYITSIEKMFEWCELTPFYMHTWDRLLYKQRSEVKKKLLEEYEEFIPWLWRSVQGENIGRKLTKEEIEILSPSLDGGEDLSPAHIAQLIETKDRISEAQKKWKTVVLFNFTWDLFHASHQQLLLVILKKAFDMYTIKQDSLYFVIGVQATSRVQKNKKKTPIESDIERVYKIGNLKYVNHAYVYFEWTEEKKPSAQVAFLKPNIIVAPTEHNNPNDMQELTENMNKLNWWKVLPIEVAGIDDEKYSDIKSFREIVSTSKIIAAVLDQHKK